MRRSTSQGAAARSARPAGLCAALVLVLPGACPAEIKLTTAATGEYQYNTNVFDLQSNVLLPGSAPSHRGDSDYGYGASLAVDDQLGLQDLFLNVTGKELRYDYFKQLDHDEYSLDGGLKWKIAGEVDGKLDVSRTRVMIAFYDLTPGAQSTLQLPIQTEQRETASAGFMAAPDFRVEGSAFHRVLDEPLTATPHLELTETLGLAAIKYVGRAGLTSGLAFSYASGHYTGGLPLDNPDYNQASVDLTAAYQANGVSNVAGELGYSRRNSAINTNDLSGFTGKVDYHNQLSGKSSVEVVLSRAINSYVANAGAEIDTLASVTFNYKLTYKTALTAFYSFTNRSFPNQGALPDTNRTDRQQDASLRVDYAIRRWLNIKPYATYETRSSGFNGASFNAGIYGINFVFHSID